MWKTDENIYIQLTTVAVNQNILKNVDQSIIKLKPSANMKRS